jgi:hypothetical protein
MTPTQPAHAKLIVAGILVFAAVAGLIIARQLTGPFVGLATQQACSSYGDELSRSVTGYEKERRLSLSGRTDGMCFYGAVTPEDGEEEAVVFGQTLTADEIAGQPATLEISLAEFDTGGLYKAVRLMSAVLQLGAASVAVRLLADPLLDRFVR